MRPLPSTRTQPRQRLFTRRDDGEGGAAHLLAEHLLEMTAELGLACGTDDSQPHLMCAGFCKTWPGLAEDQVEERGVAGLAA
ncbi:hypothetical protein HC891_08215 [Candidatus Gracilibacteria bacterium]|nr:hypothetical protein [Candidatus Gracilibacteria bacterium]